MLTDTAGIDSPRFPFLLLVRWCTRKSSKRAAGKTCGRRDPRRQGGGGGGGWGEFVVKIYDTSSIYAVRLKIFTL